MRGFIPHEEHVRATTLQVCEINNGHLTVICSSIRHFQRRNADQDFENAAEILLYNKRNIKIMQNIFGAIKEDQSNLLMACRTARTMWIKLEAEYEKAAADSIPLLWPKF